MGKRVVRLMTELLITGDGKKMGEKKEKEEIEKREARDISHCGRIGKERRRQEMEGRQVTADDMKR